MRDLCRRVDRLENQSPTRRIVVVWPGDEVPAAGDTDLVIIRVMCTDAGLGYRPRGEYAEP
jgi:hypothetical protein